MFTSSIDIYKSPKLTIYILLSDYPHTGVTSELIVISNMLRSKNYTLSPYYMYVLPVKLV